MTNTELETIMQLKANGAEDNAKKYVDEKIEELKKELLKQEA